MSFKNLGSLKKGFYFTNSLLKHSPKLLFARNVDVDEVNGGSGDV